MTLPEVLESLGINSRIVLASAMGGLLRALSRKEYKWREVILSPFCGVLAAVNLTASGVHALMQISKAFGWEMPTDAISTQRAVAFLIGISAMWIADFMFDYLAARFRSKGSQS